MRKLLAALLVALLTSLACVDQIACPDGCTDDPPAYASGAPASSGGDCVLCQHAVSLAVSVTILTPAEPVQRHDRRPGVRLVTSPAVGIEHPPRPA